ncbi:MAG TPA: SLC13 family permease [Candidatus Deferrimicrobium sp.]|nr:SLC13 family permease [Candidatus Deferrimicrobium sp.]
MIGAIIVTGCFIGVLICIVTNKLNRAVAALAGAVVTYFVLVFLEHKDFLIISELLFGTTSDGFVSFHALLLILGMLIIVQVCHSAGVFQFLSFKFIQMTKGRPVYLLLILCGVTVLLSAILNNLLTIMIIIPLTIVASRILGIDPSPYIICEGILVNLGAIIFAISSIPNILISTFAGISFIDFFLHIGLFAFILLAVTLTFFYFVYRKKLMIPKDRLTGVLEDFNVWNFVPDRRLFYKASFVLIGILICFFVIPSTVIPPDLISITGAIILVIISKLNARDILQKIDLELILYLLGIFVITGAMELLKVVELIGDGLIFITGSNVLVMLISILWISALFTSSIDSIPMAKVLIPIVNSMTTGLTPLQTKAVFYSLTYGVNLGDNLTPLGDNVLVFSIAEQNGRPLSMSQFFKLGFTAAFLQLTTITIYFILLYSLTVGLSILFIVFIILIMMVFIRFLHQYYPKDVLMRKFNQMRTPSPSTGQKMSLFQILRKIKGIIKK